MQPFFIVGLQRSGTTMLSVLLQNHPDILMEEQAIGFRIVTSIENASRLWPHNLTVSNDDFYKWLIRSDGNGRLGELIEVKKSDKFISLKDDFQSSIERKMKFHNCSHWGDKSPNLQFYTSYILQILPHSKFIHIVRDGRANAYSMHKRTPMHLKLAASNWLEGNIRGLVNQSVLGKHQYLIVHYEKLLRSPNVVLDEICQFLKIPFDNQLLDLSTDFSEDKSYVKSTFDTSKIDQWKGQLTSKQIKTVEKIQGPLLQKLGYELINSKVLINYKPPSLRSTLWVSFTDNFRLLFISGKKTMKQKEIVDIKIPIKVRLYTFASRMVKRFFHKDIFVHYFNRTFYKEKYFSENDLNNKNKVYK